METQIYVKITHALQDFHLKPRGIIHYTFVSDQTLACKEAEDMIRHTQSLFFVYFKEKRVILKNFMIGLTVMKKYKIFLLIILIYKLDIML